MVKDVSWDFWFWGIKMEGLMTIIGPMQNCWQLLTSVLGYWKRPKKHCLLSKTQTCINVYKRSTLDSLRFCSSSEIFWLYIVVSLYSLILWCGVLNEPMFTHTLSLYSLLSFHLENIIINDIFSGNLIVHFFSTL